MSILPFSADGSWVHLDFDSEISAKAPGPAFDEHCWLTADFYNPHEVILQLRLRLEAGDGRAGEIIFGLYPRIRARFRIPGTALALNSWLLPREGALLKPMCGGEVVRPVDVETLRLGLLAGPDGGADFWQSPWRVSTDEPAKLQAAESLHSVVLDELGQRVGTTWDDKTPDAAAMIHRLRTAAMEPPTLFPKDWTRWGGSAKHRFEATGFFRTHHDGRRWWLVDPEGGAFWSAGPCCVVPLSEAWINGLEHLLSWKPDESAEWAAARMLRKNGIHAGHGINFLAANLIRAFGAAEWKEAWEKLAINFLRRHRFNTIGNWSLWEIGQRADFAYTRPMSDLENLRVPKVFRDFPDVFHPDFKPACSDWALQLEATSEDPAFLGYFLCNEPTWAFASQSPAAGMLVNAGPCETRAAFAGFLQNRYSGADALSKAWGVALEFETVANGHWTSLPTTDAFVQDAEAFSAIMVARLFDELSAACRRVDPNHLNLGARFANPPPEWMVDSLRSFDVFSFNSYSKAPRPAGARLSERLNRPVLVGEWHFGAADSGLPAAGLETVPTQKDRALAYRRFLEAHAAEPWCVGAHWFTLYDQNALGRFDGEAYNCGFLDVCHRAQSEISTAARCSHEALYDIAAGTMPPATRPGPTYSRRLSL